MHKKLIVVLATLLLCFAFTREATAGTVSGQVQNAQQGPLPNGTFTFTLTQSAVVSGSASVAATSVNCYTDSNGNVVGLPTPLSATLSVNLASGTLPGGTYYIRTAWNNTSGTTQASAEQVQVLASNGTLIVTPPTNKQPGAATQYNVYIGTTSGGETLQGTVSISGGTFAAYSQSTPLIAGSALPASNTSVCSLRFNDELQPSFVCYNVGLTTQTGAMVSGYPQYFYLAGGSSGTVNLSTGTPSSSVCQGSGVVYPQAIVTTPAFNGLQSINGPLSLNGFGLTAGTVTAAPTSNGVDIFSATRQTDTSPTGNFINFKSLAGVTLFKVDINGNLTANSFTLNSFFAAAGISSTKVSRDCRQDGVVGDGITDDSTALNNCFANAYAANENVVLPAGMTFKVNTSLNDTNKPSMAVSGNGSSSPGIVSGTGEGNTNVTTILCNTGNTPCVDRLGSAQSGWDHVALLSRNSFSNPSNIGMMLGRDPALDPNGGHAYCFSEFMHDDHVFVVMETSPTANNNEGRIAYYNVGGAEIFRITSSDLTADRPLYLTTTNATVGATSAYQTIIGSCLASMEGWESSGTAYTPVSATSGGAITIEGPINGLHNFLSGDCIMNSGAASGDYCFQIGADGSYGIKQLPAFTVEQIQGGGGVAFFNGTCSDCSFDASTSVPSGMTSAWFQFSGGITTRGNSTAGIGAVDSSFKIHKINSSDVAAPLLKCSGCASPLVTIKGGHLEFGGTSTSFADTNITLTGTEVGATGFTDSNLSSTSLNSASYFKVNNDSGITQYGGTGTNNWGVKGVSNNVGGKSAVVAQGLTSANGVAIGMKALGSGADQNVWDMRLSSTGNWFLCALNDAENSVNCALEIDRSGAVPTAVKLNTPVTITNCATQSNPVPCRVFQDDRTSQSATIGPITIVTGTASTGGHYILCQAQRTTATDASGATYAITFNWTSDTFASSTAGGSLNLTSTATQQGSFCTAANVDASTNITYTVTVTGAPTTGRFAQHVWAMKE